MKCICNFVSLIWFWIRYHRFLPRLRSFGWLKHMKVILLLIQFSWDDAVIISVAGLQPLLLKPVTSNKVIGWYIFVFSVLCLIYIPLKVLNCIHIARSPTNSYRPFNHLNYIYTQIWNFFFKFNVF